MNKVQNIPGYISVSEQDKNNYSLKESFKGQVIDEELYFPVKGLGAKHPFDFEIVEKLSIKYGLVAETVDKNTNAIVTDFEIKVKNPNAQKLIDDLIHNTNFHTVIRAWVKEGVLKGNGFIEIDLDNGKIRVLNSNNMYVRRKKDGSIIEYTQYSKDFKNFNRESPDLIKFKPNQIAHLIINKIPSDAYGIGIIYQNERIIENMIKNEQDLQTIISRKAGSPYHIKVGQPGTNVPTGIVDAVKNKLLYLRNTVEWVTDGDIDIKVVDFGQLGDKIVQAQEYWFKQYCAGTGTPEYLFGSGQLNEGIAKEQSYAWKRKISSLQTLIANIIEEKIIRPYLRANGLDEQPEFIWELPTEEDINNRILRIKELLGTMPSPGLKAGLELELAKLLGLEELVNLLPSPEEAQQKADEDDQFRKDLQTQNMENKQEVPKENKENKERTKEENLPLPMVPGVLQNNNSNIKESQDMSIREWINLKEAAGFNYTDYLAKILEIIKKDPFADLIAITEQDVANGLLPSSEVEKLRLILRKGFRENQSVKEIEKEISNKVNLKDRITETGVISAASRPNLIARTETVRLANEGLVNLYKDNKIKKVSWLSAISDRTCEQCESLNGQVFNIDEINTGNGQPPLHANCRCSLLSVIE